MDLMASYLIDYTDPLTGQFSIPPGGFNGPGGSVSSSTLRLYGRGALEWGESVDENMLRLAENFAGATAPLSPVSGQLWFSTKFYYHNSAVAQPGGWYRYDPTSVAANKWSLLNGTGIVDTVQPPSPTIGSYYFSGGVLYRYDTAYKQAPSAFQTREFTEATGNPTSTNPTPEQALKVYDKHNAAWVNPVTVAVTQSGSPPSAPQTGSLWFDNLSNTLYIWDGAAYIPIVLAGGGSAGGNINLGGVYNVTGIPPQTYPLPNSQNAASISYVNQATSTGTLYGLLDSRYVNVTGDSMTGILSLGSNKITNLGYPTTSTDAATMGYADAAVAAAIGGLSIPSGASLPVINPSSPKDGDLLIGGGTASIRIGGAWFQFFPAQWV